VGCATVYVVLALSVVGQLAGDGDWFIFLMGLVVRSDRLADADGRRKSCSHASVTQYREYREQPALLSQVWAVDSTRPVIAPAFSLAVHLQAALTRPCPKKQNP